MYFIARAFVLYTLQSWYVCSTCAIQNWDRVIEAWVHKRTGNSSSRVTWQRRANVLYCTCMVVCRLAHILYASDQTLRAGIQSRPASWGRLRMEQHCLQHSRCSTAVLLLLITVLCIGAPPPISLGWWLVHSEWTTYERQQISFAGCWLYRSTAVSTKHRKAVCRLHTDVQCIEVLSDLGNWGYVGNKEQWSEHTSLRTPHEQLVTTLDSNPTRTNCVRSVR